MCVEEISAMPCVFSELAKSGVFTFYRLFDSSGEYALAAVGDRGDVLELHLEVIRWNHRVGRMMYEDVNWLKSLAGRLGKRGIVGVKQSRGSVVDHKWVRFTRKYGFDEHETIQVAGLRVDR